MYRERHFRAELNAMTELVLWMTEDLRKPLSRFCVVVQMTYDDMNNVVKRKIQEGLLDGSKKMVTHFQVESAF